MEGERRRGRAKACWNWSAGVNVSVNCYTNTEEAELFLNGKSLGKKKLKNEEDRVIEWILDFQPGELMVKGFNNGQEVSRHTLKTAGEAYALKANADPKKRNAKKKGLAYIEIVVVDEAGSPVYDASDEITVTIEGAAKLPGLENSSLTIHEDYKANKRRAFHGKLLAFVQSKGKVGDIKVTWNRKI